MAIISNFELLFKPIAPVVGPAAEIGRVAVQGYFLEISNLEYRDIKLIFRTKTSVKEPADSPNTEFTSTNHSVVYDITRDNIFETTLISAGELIAGKQLGHSVGCLTIPAGQTASLAILPNAQALFAAPTADLAIRGYVELVQSSNVDSINPLEFSSPDSARILVSAEHRGTFVDPEFNPGDPLTQTDLDFDQASYSLLTANGQALQTINTHAPFNDPFQDLLTSDFLFPEGLNFSLAGLSTKLFKDANSPQREARLKIGNVPVRIDYSIKNGKYVVEEKTTTKALNLLIQRRKLPKVSTKDLITKINKALSGDKKADVQLQKLFKESEKKVSAKKTTRRKK